MINPHLKNPRTGFHSDVLDRSAHYMKLLHSKPEVDHCWGKGELLKPSRSRLARSLEYSRNEDNIRLMSKIVNIEKRSKRYQTQESQTKKSLKNRFLEYQRDLIISEDNVKMMKKLDKIESGLSKKKMDQFCTDMKKYGKLARSSKKHASIIDDMFYRNFKIEMIRNRGESVSESANHSKFTKKKQKKQAKDLALRIEEQTEKDDLALKNEEPLFQ